MPFYTNDGLAPKRVLAHHFKEMVKTEGFESVSVSALCERSNVRNEAFPHYFKNKFHLAGWVFDSEFYNYVHRKNYGSEREFLMDMGRYFETEQEYYRALFACQIDVIESYAARRIEQVLSGFKDPCEGHDLARSVMSLLVKKISEGNFKADEICGCLSDAVYHP